VKVAVARGDRVLLRPVRQEELGVLAAARRRPQDFGRPVSSAGDMDLPLRVARSGSFAEGELLLAVEAGGRLVGEIQARQPRHGLPPGVFELGIEVYDRGDRHKGLGTEAVALMTSHLFHELGAHRVQASTDTDNAAMRALLGGLGFTEEGVLRAFMPGPEGPRDYVMYAMTRDDWETKEKRWT
jgi:[ribosomal protein S5]-alanine N-acetyltransferase